MDTKAMRNIVRVGVVSEVIPADCAARVVFEERTIRRHLFCRFSRAAERSIVISGCRISASRSCASSPATTRISQRDGSSARITQ